MRKRSIVRAAQLLLAALCSPVSAGDFCSAPLAAARAESFSLGLSTAVPAEKAFRLLEAGSAARVAQLEILLEPFSAQEKELLKVSAARPPYLVTRVKADKLRSILSGGALLSPARVVAAAATAEKPFTPVIEDLLFGGHSCVFASYGPYAGRARYGDVLFRLAPEGLADRTWGSRASGWHFLASKRGLDPKTEVSVSFDDISAFTGTVFSGRDLPRVFPLMTVAFLRGKPAEERARLIRELLDAADGPAFYALVDEHHLGYLEAKIDSSVPLSAVTAIEVPPDLLDEVLAWPEAGPYKKIIGALTD